MNYVNVACFVMLLVVYVFSVLLLYIYVQEVATNKANMIATANSSIRIISRSKKNMIM
jgi:hypothetical protein